MRYLICLFFLIGCAGENEQNHVKTVCTDDLQFAQLLPHAIWVWNTQATVDITRDDIPPDHLDGLGVLLHELGHAYTLEHAEARPALMYKSFTFGEKRRTLTPPDMQLMTSPPIHFRIDNASCDILITWDDAFPEAARYTAERITFNPNWPWYLGILF